MQWILQEFEDNYKLAEALERLSIEYSMHKVIPFIGELDPEPVISDNKVVLFGSYSLRHYARKHGLYPGVFELEPFFNQTWWHPHLVNGPHNTHVAKLDEVIGLNLADKLYFIRPLDDSKEIAGKVMELDELERTVNAACSLKPEEEIKGSLNRDTILLIGEPQQILKEWRIWVVDDNIVTFSLYKEGSRVIYRYGIDDGALRFAFDMVKLNRGYSQAYVLDVCLTRNGYKILETNCINAAGFYAADLQNLAAAVSEL